MSTVNKGNELGMVMFVRLHAHYAALHSCMNSPKHYHPVISGVRFPKHEFIKIVGGFKCQLY